MPIQTTQGPIAAVASYTPMDYTTQLQAMQGKVAEVETAAQTGRQALAKLNFQDGYYTRGLSNQLQGEYSTKVNNLVNNLYESGDATKFSQGLAMLQGEINTDERVKAGKLDYLKSKEHDQRSSNPDAHKYFYSYTEDNSPVGKINPGDWNQGITEEDVTRFYNVLPPEDLYTDYIEKLQNLDNLKLEEFLGYDENGFLNVLTSSGPIDFPDGTTPAEAIVAKLKEVNPNLYILIRDDYKKGGTSSAINYKGRGLSEEEFIRDVILQNEPFLRDKAVSLQQPSRSSQNTTVVPELTPMTSEAFATVIDPVSLTSADVPVTIDQVYNALDLNNSNDLASLQILSENREGKANKAELNTIAFQVNLLNDFNNNGDPNFQEVFRNGNELKASAAEATNGILETNKFSETYGQLFRQGESAADYFSRVKNTLRYLGKATVSDLMYNKDSILPAYDDFNQSDDLVKMFTFGTGVLTKEEMAAFVETNASIIPPEALAEPQIDPRREPPIDFGAVSAEDFQDIYTHISNPFDASLEEYIKQSNNYYSEDDQDYTKAYRGAAPFALESTTELLALKESSPIAFYEAARRNYLENASLYYSDILIGAGNVQQKQAIFEEDTKALAENWAKYGTADLAANWNIVEVVQSASGGTTMTTESGFESPRISGNMEISSPYKDLSTSQFGVLTKSFVKQEEDDKWIFQGFIVPQGQASETGLMFTHIDDSTNTTKNYIFQPKRPTVLANTPHWQDLSGTQKTLAGKTYKPVVATGDAMINQFGEDIGSLLVENADLYGINVDYVWNNTAAKLSNTKMFRVAEDSYYNDGEHAVVAKVAGGNEIYRVERRGGDVSTWGDYLGDTKDIDLGKTYLGTADYEDFIVSLVIEGKISEDVLPDLLNKSTMSSLSGISKTTGLSVDQLLKTPVSFGNTKSAFKHFSQADAGENSAGIKKRGLFVKT